MGTARKTRSGSRTPSPAPNYGPLTRAFDWQKEDPAIVDRIAQAIGRCPSNGYGGGNSLPKGHGSDSHVYYDIDRLHDDDRDEELRREAEAAHGHRVQAVKALLTREGFDPEKSAYLEIGDKAWVTLNVHLNKLVEKDVLEMRARVADGKVTAAQLAQMASIEDDKVLLARIAVSERANSDTLAALFAKGLPNVDQALARNGKCPKDILSGIWQRHLEAAESRASGAIRLALATNRKLPKSLLSKLAKSAAGRKDRELLAALASNPAWDDEARKAFLTGQADEAARAVARLSLSSPATLLDAARSLADALKEGRIKKDSWAAQDALRDLAKHPSSTDEVLRVVLGASHGEGRTGLIALAAASDGASEELLGELADEIVRMYEAPEEAVKALALNPRTPSDRLIRLNENYVKAGRYRASKRWFGGPVAEALARRLGYLDEAGESSRGGKKAKTAEAALIEKVKAPMPTGVIVEMVKTVPGLPAAVLDAIIARFDGDISYRDAIGADVLTHLIGQENLSAESLHKVTSVLSKLEEQRTASYADQGALKARKAVLAARFEVEEVLAGGDGVYSKKMKDRIHVLIRHGGREVYEATFSSERLPPKLAKYVMAQRKELAPNRRIYALLAANPACPPEVLEELAGMSAWDLDGDNRSRETHGLVAANPATPTSTLTELARSPSASVRYAVAANKRTPREILKKLVDDYEGHVRSAAAETLADRRY